MSLRDPSQKPPLALRYSQFRDRTSSCSTRSLLPHLGEVVVFSHLRWDFVFQRPQHLLTRCALEYPVWYVEEPLFDAPGAPGLEIKPRENGVRVVVPHLPPGQGEAQVHAALRQLLDGLVAEQELEAYTLWYATPMALTFSRHLRPLGIVYDCMDELSMFKGAHPMLLSLEQELFEKADVVFTGGRSLFEYKRHCHSNIHAFPSSIDVAHFRKARSAQTVEPDDQQGIAGPRIGYFGVVDERMDLGILDALAASHPEWQVIVLGPVIKVDPGTLPVRPNLHYLGSKSYQQLPAYIKGWDVAILPFARNDSTRFISPTKTPEYLAAGVPIVSTSIRDVVHPYEQLELVRIADDPGDFVRSVQAQLELSKEARAAWLGRADEFLASESWDHTWGRMLGLISRSLARDDGGPGAPGAPDAPDAPDALPAQGVPVQNVTNPLPSP